VHKFNPTNFYVFQSENFDECCEGDSKYLAREVLNSHITKESIMFSLGLSILQIATDLYLPSSGQRWHDVRNLNIDPRFTARELLKV
jgi:hypothetical protein